MLMQEQVDYVVVPEGPVNVNELLNTPASLQRRVLLLFDVHPREVYMPRFLPGAVEGAEKPLEDVARAINSLLAVAKSDSAGRLRVLLTASDDELKALGVELDTAAEYSVDLSDVEFLAEVVRSYMGESAKSCQGVEKLARIIKEHHPKGAYTLVAKYAGLWLRERGCDVSDVERAVEEAKKEPKLFFAHYIWHVLLRSSGDLAMQAAVPLLLHAYFGPVPVGVTYITKAVDEGGRWRLSTPEGLEGADLQSLKKDALEPIAKWLAQWHEDLVEEVLRDLAGLNGEEARETYREALRDLIKTLDWARREVLKEGSKIIAELNVADEGSALWIALPAFVARRLAAVFKSGEIRSCWHRAALIAGHALAVQAMPRDVAKALGNALSPCAVDDYLMIDSEIPPLSIGVAQLMPKRELNILSSFADAKTIDAARKTAEGLLARWRRGDITLTETLYALGLAAMAAGGEVDGETADRLLYAASFAVQWAAHPVALSMVLSALRPLGEKAPHRYVVALAAASELETLDQKTVRYVYDALQQLKDRILKTGRLWSLVEAIRAYSNLLVKYLDDIKDRWEETVVNMCELYSKVRERSAEAALESGLSAQRLLDAVARANVLAVTLVSDDLAPLVQRYCGLGDLEREAEAVRSVLNKAATTATDHPKELKKIAENDTDFAEWVTARNVIGDARIVVEDLSAWFTAVLTQYKLVHALDEKGELDARKLEEASKEFENLAKIYKKLRLWGNYLAVCDLALRARVLAAKSWKELLERAEGFQKLWREAGTYPELTAGYLATAAHILGEYLVYLALSGNKDMAEELLKKRRWLLDYVPEFSVVTRLMLRLFGVREGARQVEVVVVFGPLISPEFRPALSMLAGRLQKDKVPDECAKFIPPWPEALYAVARSVKFKSELCVDAVASAAGNRVAAEILRLVLRSATESEASEARPLLNKADGRTLVEVLAPKYSSARLAFMLLAAVEGRTKAVRVHGLLGSLAYLGTIGQPLFRAVYENCGDLNSEKCRLALLKLYYYHH